MNIEEQKKELEELIKKLIALGEDADELNFWTEMFDTMDEGARSKLLSNLSKEATDLEKA
ncbi:MAG: hypothetical protein UT98_C0005G0023 [Candidatus Nomurabacteria bacterium GW2011_GWF2_40_31]|uniref:Uncharacterized protein n=2 Tax=Candidatus Nomuraibacteriota TaxID=1752729 RepID=A0A837I0R9_9BACT|nr:MAG: hypothetical protein UT27_C0010G0023 [Candidatus Nomurabacteria bacterium GW2011_GWD2_39_12]KKR20120.1 MAG: hypothetical protein UT51_C0008G0023 [Candidatus Nomurabacteria bacterium GW2011_GWC2_39_41]KKR36637.1 MAG: hypothetical protein UT70_C0008G0023 [Candidatus Nomurabacteria bacterium GW2011_GWE2_40_10]KKR38056.1 MAG: hypothetical protein UT73_C0007G0023 [Candidatus Nomurabacteria bacterium GW2011_GWB1_40_11]KKR39540.1 MAG: hypothetical protein UT74_C0010G0023 [Parcubacteria group b